MWVSQSAKSENASRKGPVPFANSSQGLMLALAQRGSGTPADELIRDKSWLQIQLAAELEVRLMNEEAKRWE